MARHVLLAEVSGGWVRGRSGLGWIDGVKAAFGSRSMTVEVARKHQNKRRAASAYVDRVSRAIFV